MVFPFLTTKWYLASTLVLDVGPAMMQRVMKANGKYEDQSTHCQLTSKEHMCPALHKEKDAFQTTVAD